MEKLSSCVPSKAKTAEREVVNGNVVLGGWKKCAAIAKREPNMDNPCAFVVSRREVVTPCGSDDASWRTSRFSFQQGTKSRSTR